MDHGEDRATGLGSRGGQRPPPRRRCLRDVCVHGRNMHALRHGRFGQVVVDHARRAFTNTVNREVPTPKWMEKYGCLARVMSTVVLVVVTHIHLIGTVASCMAIGKLCFLPLFELVRPACPAPRCLFGKFNILVGTVEQLLGERACYGARPLSSCRHNSSFGKKVQGSALHCTALHRCTAASRGNSVPTVHQLLS